MSTLHYELIRAQKKSISLSLNKEGTPIVRAPLRMPKHEIDAFVAKHNDWLVKQLERFEQNHENIHSISSSEIALLKKTGYDIIQRKVAHYSAIMNLAPTGIKITSANSRYGSCNHKNSLCFSYMLLLQENSFIDYVVVHELAHIKEKNHSPRFYAIIERYMPDYKERLKRQKQAVRNVRQVPPIK